MFYSHESSSPLSHRRMPFDACLTISQFSPVTNTALRPFGKPNLEYKADRIVLIISRVIAMIGPRGGTRKVTRKAIEDVNIRKACEKIIEPSAPISLRLQSNLLYGVSRVFSSQCNYMLTDTEKVQAMMKTFYRLIANNQTDPNAGRVR